MGQVLKSAGADGDALIASSLATSPNFCLEGLPLLQCGEAAVESPAWRQVPADLFSHTAGSPDCLSSIVNTADCLNTRSTPSSTQTGGVSPESETPQRPAPQLQLQPLHAHQRRLPTHSSFALLAQAAPQEVPTDCSEAGNPTASACMHKQALARASTPPASLQPAGSLTTAAAASTSDEQVVRDPKPDAAGDSCGGGDGHSATPVAHTLAHPSARHVTMTAAVTTTAMVAGAGLAAYSAPVITTAASDAASAVMALAVEAVTTVLLRLVGAALFSAAVLVGVFAVAAAARFVVRLAVPPVDSDRPLSGHEGSSDNEQRQRGPLLGGRRHDPPRLLLPLPPLKPLPEQQQQQQKAQLPLTTTVTALVHQHEHPAPSNHRQQSQQEPGGTDLAAAAALSVASNTAAGAGARPDRLGNPDVLSPFTTTGMVPSHLSAGSKTQQHDSVHTSPSANGGGGPGGAGTGHLNGGHGGSPGRSTWSWGLQGWCGHGRSPAPSLRSWVHLAQQQGVEDCSRHSSAVVIGGGGAVDAVDGAGPGGPSAVADAGTGDATRDPPGKSVSSISSAEECGSGGGSGAPRDAQVVGRPAPPPSCGTMGHVATLPLAQSQARSHSLYVPSITRLWHAALPGLHLLLRPQRQQQPELAAHTMGSWTMPQQMMRRAPSGGSLAPGGSCATASPKASGTNQQYGHGPYRQNEPAFGMVQLARAMSTLVSASFSGLFGLILSSSTRGSAMQMPATSGTGGTNSQERWRLSNGSTLGSMVSELLPRATGDWGMQRSASNSSLTALMEAATAVGSSAGAHHSGGSAGAGANTGGAAASAGAAGATPSWDPLQTGSAHAFLLSSAEAAARKPAFSDLPQNAGRVQVLSVDDEPVNQQVMRALLWAAEYDVLEAHSGEDALAMIRHREVLPDLVLLDVTLGGSVSGFEVCLEIRREYSPGELPVIMITCSSLEEDVIRGLAVGANDYLIKPLRNLELMARIKTQLALKRSIRVAAEARVNRSLLGSILPANVIRQLKQGVTLIAQFHQEVTILFSDIRGFTNLATEWPTEQIILMLNNMFTAFDRLCDRMGVYKVETIGDAYMIVSGHDGVADHAPRMLRMATHMLAAVAEMRGFDGRELQIRVGIHTGPAHSGVVGLSRPRYCFFGDTVNTASRMESTGFPMAIQVSESTLQAANAHPGCASEFQFAPCGPRDIKGKGVMNTYLLRVGLYEKALAELASAAALAHASVTAGTTHATGRRGDVVAAAAAAATEPTRTGHVGADANGAPSSAPALAERLESDSAVAPPLQLPQEEALPPAGRKIGAGGVSQVAAPALGSAGAVHWRINQMGAGLASAADHGCDPVEDIKYASYRYHHSHMSGMDVMSSTGTNVLMDNGLAVLVPSHVMDGSLLDSLDPGQGSSALRAAAAIASGGSGGGPAPTLPAALMRTGLPFSGSMSITYMPPPSPTSGKRPTAAAAAADTAAASGLMPRALGPPGVLPTGVSPANSARPSLDHSGRAAPATSSTLGTGAGAGAETSGTFVSYSRTASGVSNAPAVGADSGDSRLAAVQRSKPPSPLCGSQPCVSASTLNTARTTSTEASLDTLEEPSLHYAVNRGGGGTGTRALASPGADGGASPTHGRFLSGMAAAAFETAAGSGWPDAPGMRPHRGQLEQLRRSAMRTSEELTAAAAAAVAAAVSNTSGDDDAAASASAAAGAASAVQPLELDTILMSGACAGDLAAVQTSSSRNAAGGGASAAVTTTVATTGNTTASGEGALVASIAGWSVLVETLDPATATQTLVSRSSTHDAGHSLGSWIQAGDSRPSTSAQSSAVPSVSPQTPPAPPPQRATLPKPAGMAGLAAAIPTSGPPTDMSLDLEPTLAVAAEALVAAIDSALNSDAGDLIAEAAALAFGRSGTAGAAVGEASRSGLCGSPVQTRRLHISVTPFSEPAPAAVAPASQDIAPPHHRATEVTTEMHAAHDGRRRQGCNSPTLIPATQATASRLRRTTSNGGDAVAGLGVAWPPSVSSRFSYEQPPLAGRATGLVTGGRTNGGDADGDGAHDRGLPGPSSAGCTSAVIVSGASGSLTRAAGGADGGVVVAHSGIYSPRHGPGRAPWGRPGTYKRPATATGTVCTGTNLAPGAAARYFARETAPPLAGHSGGGGGGSAGSGGAGSVAGGSDGVSLAAALAQRGGSGSSGGGGSGGGGNGGVIAGAGLARQRAATAHGASTVRFHGLAEHGSSTAAPAAALFRSQMAPLASASLFTAHEEGSAHQGPSAASGNGEDLPCRAWANQSALLRTNSGASPRTTSHGQQLQLNSRKSLNCAPQGAGAGAAAATASGPGCALLTSGGSMGGVSIISQGWSNLYDPLVPRPRLTDHYCTSGDLEDFGSAGARTPGSILSPSVGSGQVLDCSAYPSPSQLTPAHSANVPASGANEAAATQPAAVGSRGGGQAAPQSRPQAAGGDTAGGSEPIFGEPSGVASAHDVVYGVANDIYGDAGEALAEANQRALSPMEAPTAAPAAAAATQDPSRGGYSRGSAALGEKATPRLGSLGRNCSLDLGGRTGGSNLGSPGSAGNSCYSGLGDSAYGTIQVRHQAHIGLYAVHRQDGGGGVFGGGGGGSGGGADSAPSLLKPGGEEAFLGPPSARTDVAAAAAAAVPSASGSLDPRGSGASPKPPPWTTSPRSTTIAAAAAAPYGVAGAALGAGVPFNRRHSVDVVRRCPPPAHIAVGTPGPSSPSAATAAATGGQMAGSPTSYNKWYGGGGSYAAPGVAVGRVEVPGRTSTDMARKRGPSAFGSPIVPLGAAGAAQGDGAGGGLDIARMLARASELVVVPQGQEGSGGRDGAADGGGGSASAQPQSPAQRSVAPGGAPSLPEMNGQPPTAAASDGGGGAAPLGAGPMVAADPPGEHQSQYAQTHHHHNPYHGHFNQNHVAYPQQHQHHVPEGVPYGMTQPVHISRLDPVEEGCGSSTALTVDASSSSIPGRSPTAATAANGGSSGSSGEGGIAAAVRFAAASATTPAAAVAVDPHKNFRAGSFSADPRLSSDDHYRVLRPQSPTAAAAAAAAAMGASLSNSGPGSTSPPLSHQASAVTQQQGRGVGVAAAAAAAVAAGGSNSDMSSTGTAAAAPPPPRPAQGKRSFTNMLLKVKRALRSGGTGSGSGAAAAADPR